MIPRAEDGHPLQSAAGEHVEQAQHGALGPGEERSQGVGVHPREWGMKQPTR